MNQIKSFLLKIVSVGYHVQAMNCWLIKNDLREILNIGERNINIKYELYMNTYLCTEYTCTYHERKHAYPHTTNLKLSFNTFKSDIMCKQLKRINKHSFHRTVHIFFSSQIQYYLWDCVTYCFWKQNHQWIFLKCTSQVLLMSEYLY